MGRLAAFAARARAPRRARRGRGGGALSLAFREHTLHLRHAFTLSRERISEKRTFFVELEHDGLTGRGEAAPVARFGETPESCRAALERIAGLLADRAGDTTRLIQALEAVAPDAPAARSAVDAALMDWSGKAAGIPLYQLVHARPGQMPPTSMTIAMDTPERMRQRAREAGGFQVLKIKVGGPRDHAAIEAVAGATGAMLRVDANEGFRDRETALREIDWLAEQNVELVEQPLPANRIDDMRWLKERSPLPLIADEALMSAADLPLLAEAYDGVNIKLVKCGGTVAAREAIRLARSFDLEVMIGCTVESSLGIAAAAHLAPLADYADLDGNLLIANDPFEGHPVVDGRIALRDAPGLGIA